MIRVVKPGGIVVVIDVDHDTFVTNLTNHELSRKFTKANCVQIPNGWIGRRLPGLIHSYGLTDINVVPTALCKTNCDVADVKGMLNGALSDNRLTQAEADEIMQEIQDLDYNGPSFRFIRTFRESSKYNQATFLALEPITDRIFSGRWLNRSKHFWAASSNACLVSNSSQWVTSRRKCRHNISMGLSHGL